MGGGLQLPTGQLEAPPSKPDKKFDNFFQNLSDWDTAEVLCPVAFFIFGTIWHSVSAPKEQKMDQSLFEGKLTVSLPQAAEAAFGWMPSTTASYLCRGKFPIPFVNMGGVKRVRVFDLINFVGGFQPVSSSSPKKKPGRPTKAVQLARAAGGAA